MGAKRLVRKPEGNELLRSLVLCLCGKKMLKRALEITGVYRLDWIQLARIGPR